jgi:hypothetical protein
VVGIADGWKLYRFTDADIGFYWTLHEDVHAMVCKPSRIRVRTERQLAKRL